MKTGTVVISQKGHDKDNFYVVIGKEENLVLLCDGKSKKLSNPKRKNPTHLKETGFCIDLSVYSPLYDAHIRKELKCIKHTGAKPEMPNN